MLLSARPSNSDVTGMVGKFAAMQPFGCHAAMRLQLPCSHAIAVCHAAMRLPPAWPRVLRISVFLYTGLHTFRLLRHLGVTLHVRPLNPHSAERHCDRLLPRGCTNVRSRSLSSLKMGTCMPPGRGEACLPGMLPGLGFRPRSPFPRSIACPPPPSGS